MNRQQRQPQNEIVSWYKDIPICTRFLFTSFILVTVLGNTVVSPHNLAHIPQFTFYKLQIWRLYTSFFLYRLSLSGAFQLYFLYTYSRDVEIDKFLGRTADYIVGWFFGFTLFNQSLVMAIIYIWSQHHREAIVNFMFGIRFKGVYLPFVLLIFEMLQVGGIPLASLIGVFTGHIYHYLQEIYPATGGRRFLNTPQWLYYWFPTNISSASGIRTTFGTILNPGRNAPRTESTSRNWGRGYRLGN
ncbi:Derlin-1 [Rhizophagus diaphanus]|nr:Derlin-1 [Rhizophagus diaphanus] [Rhizophagus sp. MUCL 43196]